MRETVLLTSLVCLTFGQPAVAADLGKIDRTIAKEPEYQSKAPRYCLLVFGPDAKTRIWLVLDGSVLYVDRNGNGDLTDKGERFKARWKSGDGSYGGREFEIPELRESDGKARHTNLRVHAWHFKGRPAVCRLSIKLADKRTQSTGFGLATFELAELPKDAPIVHFNGPLTMMLGEGQVLSGPSDTPASLSAWIGTAGLGKGTFAMIDFEGIPEGMHPVAQVAFPSKRPGGKPIDVRAVLKERC
jgi:hypothetical protein